MKITRKIAVLLAIFTMLFPLFAVCVNAEDGFSETPNLSSNNAVVVYCLDDEEILWSNRKDEKVDPAVATKLVTAMVVMDVIAERGFSVSAIEAFAVAEALDWGNPYNQRMPYVNLSAKKTYSVEYLLQAMLVGNAFDAANVLAYHFGENFLGGSVDSFIEKMNEKAAEAGATNTKFVNATGIKAEGQYTTPYDVALITAKFYEYNTLVNYSNASTFGKSNIVSKNFLKDGSKVMGYVNDAAIGLIAGQLDIYGNYCLITAVQEKGRTYFFIIMCAPGMSIDKTTGVWSFPAGNAYEDANALIKWLKTSFELLSIASADTVVGELRLDFGSSSDHIMVYPAEAVEKLVLKNISGDITSTITYDTSLVYKKVFNGTECDTIKAPVSYGQKVGVITFTHGDKVVATVDAIVKDSAEEDKVLSSMASIKDFLFGPVMKTIFIIVVSILGIYIIVVITMAIIRTVKRIKNREKKNNDVQSGQKNGEKRKMKDSASPKGKSESEK